MVAILEKLRSIAAIISILCFSQPLTAAGRDTAMVCGKVERLDYHLRVGAPRSAQTISLYWIEESSGDGYYTSVTLPERFNDESGILPAALYKIYRRSGQSNEVVDEGEVEADYGTGRQAGFSVVIRKRKSGCILEMGGTRAATTIEVPFVYDKSILIYAEVPQRLAIKRSTLTFMPMPDHIEGPYRNMEDLLEYIKSSNDSKVGIWKYLDRKTDKDKAEPGGKYTLACVEAEKGYDLIYLDGDTSGSWEQLQVKGHLEPSGFIDNYDMTWYTADGHIYKSDTNASFTNEGSILECRFPEVDGLIRFKRLADCR